MGITVEDIKALLADFQWLRDHLVPELPERDPALWAIAQDKQKAKERLATRPPRALTRDNIDTVMGWNRPEGKLPLEDAPPEEVYRRLDPDYTKPEFKARAAWKKDIAATRERIDLRLVCLKAPLAQLTELRPGLYSRSNTWKEYRAASTIGGQFQIDSVIQDLKRIRVKLPRTQPPPVEKGLAGTRVQPSGDKTTRPLKTTGKRAKRTRITSRISPRQEEAYALYHTRGLTLAQAAMEMGCSYQNVSELLKKAEAKVNAMRSRSINLSKAQKLPTGEDGEPLL